MPYPTTTVERPIERRQLEQEGSRRRAARRTLIGSRAACAGRFDPSEEEDQAKVCSDSNHRVQNNENCALQNWGGEEGGGAGQLISSKRGENQFQEQINSATRALSHSPRAYTQCLHFNVANYRCYHHWCTIFFFLSVLYDAAGCKLLCVVALCSWMRGSVSFDPSRVSQLSREFVCWFLFLTEARKTAACFLGPVEEIPGPRMRRNFQVGFHI